MRPTKNGKDASTASKRGRWSRVEQARLRELYGLRDNEVIARKLRRSVAGVLRMAHSLFPPQTKIGPWTAGETLELKRYLGATTPGTIARILGRSEAEVQEQIIDLARIRRRGAWTRGETAQFKRIYGKRADEDLACIFGRSTEEVGRLAHEHGLAKDKAFVCRLRGVGATPMLQWKPAELRIIQDSYASQPNLEIARRLGRSVKSVVSKAHQLRLRKSTRRLREVGLRNVSVRYFSA